MAGMPEVRLSPAIRRQVDADPLQVEASTTGNLYASEDGGDSWSTVDANLPPVYSVEITCG
jgi:hypothetical protein